MSLRGFYKPQPDDAPYRQRPRKPRIYRGARAFLRGVKEAGETAASTPGSDSGSRGSQTRYR